MTVREYIGARYVPLFIGEWDNTKTYEPLSIVTYQGNSYTSRQYVPVGINIANNAYWAETGTYNSQVEAYRQEVLGFDGRITSVENDLERISKQVEDDNLFVGIPLIKGSCTVVKTVDKAFIVDCGDTGDGTAIGTYLAGHGIDRLDAVVISHFHHDHCNGFGELLSYIDSDTDIYIQMELPSTNGDFAFYQQAKNTLNGIVSANNLKTPVIPVEFTDYVYGDVNLTFFNTDTSNRAAYEGSWANNGTYTERTTSNNNYSLITRFDYFDSSYVDCGDVEGCAQQMNYMKMHECSCAKIPHHCGNYMGYYKFFDRLNPDAWIYNIYDNTTVDPIDIYKIYASWHYRFIKYRNLKSIYTNAITTVEVVISNDCIVSRDGFEISQDGRTYESVTGQNSYTFYMCLPCEYYNDNPYILYTMELSDFVTLVKSLPYTVEVTASGSSDFISNSVIYGELSQIFSGYDDPTFRIFAGNTALIVRINTWYGQYYCAEIYNNIDLEANTGYRLYTEGSIAGKIYEFATNITTGDGILSEARTLLHCTRLACRIADSGVWVVCSTAPATNEERLITTAYNWYRGVYHSTVNPHIYTVVEIHSTTLTCAKRYNTQNDTVADVEIDAFMVVE